MESYVSIVDKMAKEQLFFNLRLENENLKAELNQLNIKPMKNQFFYTVEQVVPPTAGSAAGAEPVTVNKMASFNLEKVIRSLEIDEGKLVVILDDFHEEERKAVVNNANGKPMVKMEKILLQSEIILNPLDKERFRRATSIYEDLTVDTDALEQLTRQ